MEVIMGKIKKWLTISALALLLQATHSWTCPVIVQNDTEYPCTVENMEDDAPQRIIELKAGQKTQFGQKGTHAHFNVKREYTTYDGTSVHKAAELQQTGCSKKNEPIIVSVSALFAEQRDPMLPFFDLFDVLYEE